LKQYEEQFGIVSATLVAKIGEIKSKPMSSIVLRKDADALIEDATDVVSEIQTTETIL
jgi:hypothetical protein